MTKSFKTLLVLINFLAIPALSFAQVTVIAEDDFESGGWSGGTGWSGDWIHSSRAYVHSDMSPYEGTYHLKLRKNGNASRTVDMTGKTNARASFYWKAFHWEAGDRAAVMIYDGAWHNILAKSDGDDDNLWHFADIDLSIYNMISDFQIKVIQYCRQTGDYFYIDNLEITADGDPTPSPAVYYIDPAGDDTNPGTSEATPWQTLAKVNATTFSPGDTILFKANCSWIGTLWPKGSGTADDPIIINSYGEGNRPIISLAPDNVASSNGKWSYDGPAGNTLYLYNQSYWEINNLEITCAATTPGYRRGVFVHSHLAQLEHIHLNNLYIHDIVGHMGTATGSTRKESKTTGGIFFAVEGKTGNKATEPKFTDILVENCTIAYVDRTALFIYDIFGSPSIWDYYADDSGSYDELIDPNDKEIMGVDIVVRNNTVYEIGGDGIVLAYNNAPLIEHNVAYEVSTKALDSSANTWTWQCEDALFQYNEAYLTRQPAVTNNDGMAWDADFGRRTLYQYNYSHDNEGGAMMICSWGAPGNSTGHIFRYNISQNDGEGGTEEVIIRTHDGGDGSFYNNVFYLNSNSMAVFDETGDISAPFYPGYPHYFYNNVFYNAAGSNNYMWPDNSSPDYTVDFDFNAVYGFTDTPEGVVIIDDPLLVNPGSGGNGIDTVTGYQLQPTSPLRDAGTIISNNGGEDFWGNVLYNGSPDIGVHEY